MTILLLFTDGAARGNPGPAAGGAVLTRENGEILAETREVFGPQTNNVAEYRALGLGLRTAADFVKKLRATRLRAYLDSRLVAEQMAGNFKVKNPGLKIELVAAREAAAALGIPVDFFAIPRAKNARADALANLALDEKVG